ncbi:response regulator [Aquimarina sp. RZ0]|uniref:response regulator n=1 Tax=Aquimarina sp. RZ0 TaxID=2607730 RepID=UPI0011F398EB|nr:response regulator [Aquimarina sp. RZ0]KAA1243720.1 response regulator [Aquimarina sp. RZ0]
MFNVLTTYFLLFSALICNSQNIVLDSVNVPENFKNRYHISKEELTIDDILKVDKKEFSNREIKNVEIGTSYWNIFSFTLNTDVPPKYIEFNFAVTDKITLYVPGKNGEYKNLITGLSYPTQKIVSLQESSKILLEAKDINFSKPFYTHNKPMTVYGLQSINEQGNVITYNEKPLYENSELRKILIDNITFDFQFFLLIGMIMISFVFMFLHYLIMRKVYFLSYALYLFFLIFNYGYRTPFFYNFYSEIHPNLYFYLNQNCQMLANLSYMFFAKQFIDIKQYYPRLNPVYNFAIYLFITFIVIYNIIIITNPFYPYHEDIMKTSVYILSLISLGFVVYMFVKRKLTYTAIIFIGSIMLLIGYILCIVLDNFFILVPLVVIETTLFMSVISYLDLRNFKKALESDKLRQINEFKSKFFSSISHEFRTPLTLISVPIQEKLEDNNLSEKDRSDFEMINRNNKRLLSLVDQLLDLSRIEGGSLSLKVRNGNIYNLLDVIANSFIHLSNKKNISYDIKIPEGEDVEACFDPDVIEKIIVNLLSNAFKYTLNGGSVILKVNSYTNWLNLEIKNTGNGLSKEQLNRIFDRFYQVDENMEGSGIGLTLVKELVGLHKGLIEADSELNKWACFSIKIPISNDVYLKEEILNAELNENKNLQIHLDPSLPIESNKTSSEDAPVLLIVEDNIDLTKILKEAFENSFNVVIANNGQNGVELALEYIPDIIISDIMMPIKDGITLTKELKNNESTSHIPIILLTAKVGEENELTGIETGADDYMYKPFSKKILVAKVKNILESRKKLQRKYSGKSIFKINPINISPIDQEFLNKIETVFNEKLTDPSFNVKELSKYLNPSLRTIERKLKAITGLTPVEFIEFHRLELGAELLKKDSNIRIQEVAYDVGFNSPSYFSERFKEKYGCSPTDYQYKN